MPLPPPVRCSGFFHLPELWLGSEPPWDAPPEHTQEVIGQRTVGHDIVARAYRDGLVMFDFGVTSGEEYWADQFKELRNRAVIVNTYIACLHTALLLDSGYVTQKTTADRMSIVHRADL